jgi:cell division septation protein DedD
MRHHIAHKTLFLMLLGAFFAAMSASCNAVPSNPPPAAENSDRLFNGREPSGQVDQKRENRLAAALDPAGGGSGGDKKSEKDAKAKKGKEKKDEKPAANSQREDDQPTSTWSLVLGTFTEGDHSAAAREMIKNLRIIAPQVQGARVHTTPKGSMVVYGHYAGRDDPKAKDDQENLKAITYRGRKVFERIILTYLDLRLAGGQLHPHDLLSARKAHPKVDPMYTLDVAIWMTIDDPKAGKDRLSYDQVRAKAEAYCKKLRAEGYEAYFYHDDANQRSMVTVGLFDRRAIDPQSGFYSNDVEALVKKFPARYVNGEPLYEYTDKFKITKDTKTKPQSPKLVLVPAL